MEPRLLLVHFLRDTLGLTGTHVGCDTSNCGACTVHLDGDAVKSCTVLAVQADGSEVKTIEGMGTEGDLHPMQEAFWKNHGLQCGYCTPGMIMAGADLIAKNPDPSEEEVREALAGQPLPLYGLPQHRQGGAGRRRAVEGGAGMSAVEQATPSQKWVGQAMRRKEDARMITGRGNYVDDLVLSGMLYMAVVRSTEAHAKITSIDTAAAKEAAGVHGVFTSEDLKLEAPIPMVWIPPGVEVKTPGDLAARQGRRQVRRPAGRRRGRQRQVRRRRRRRAGGGRVRPAARGRRPREGARVRLAARARGVRDQPVARVDDRRRRYGHRVERRRCGHRAADRQSPDRGHPDRDARLRRRLPRRHAHRAPHEPEPAPRPPLHGRRARNVRGEDPHHRARRRRRLRREDHALPRGDHRRRRVARAGPAGQVDRDALGAHDVDDPRPRPDRLREDRRQARRHDHRPPVHGDLPTSARTSRR